jgi:hypothetical protein
VSVPGVMSPISPKCVESMMKFAVCGNGGGVCMSSAMSWEGRVSPVNGISALSQDGEMQRGEGEG